MASGDKEHRMLFDIRGRRGNVVKVIYAILAVLMGLSLLLLAGPGIGGLGGGGGANNDEAVSRLEDRIVKFERELAKEPQNADLMVALTRNHLSTANLLAEPSPTGELLPTVESRGQLEKASGTWSEYLKATDEPSAGVAQQMSQALFVLAQTSRGLSEANNNIVAAAEAQKLVADQRPSLGSRSTQALYTLYTFDYKAAEQALAQAMKFANTKTERKSLQEQYDEVEKRAKEFQKEFKESKKLEKQAGAAGNPQESLQNPLGLGSGSGGLAE
ncbi:MAG TPA: hypothetical protein VMS60_14645 [Solirubrobacterales bacterium]|nr:hypothetical protein [Solirubrobacterales bacterium]